MSYLPTLLSSKVSAPHWHRIGVYPHHGFCLHLASLLSEESLGIGEFFDLLPLIDWARHIGLDVIQLLPIHDTGFDPSPFNPTSSCALNPVYLRLTKLPDLYELDGIQSKLKALQDCNRSSHVPFAEVKRRKLSLLKDYFRRHQKNLHHAHAFQAFFHKNPWLTEYGLFQAIQKDPIFPKPPEKELFHLMKIHADELQFQSFVQYLCYEQMQEVKRYATEKRVFLKGDIPLSVSLESADVWFHGDLFNVNLIAGAPPDMYNAQGQLWGSPLYNWTEHKNRNYFWWTRRLQEAEKLFHLYRMDHVVGYFRIWGIPPGKKAMDGAFVCNNRYLWPEHGREKLNMLLQSSYMLPIAEDLGTIPGEVYATLKDLGIPGTKIPRWSRYEQEDGSLIKPRDYDPVSLTSVSTHDSETLRQWWENNPLEAKEFAATRSWRYETKCTSNIREKLLQDAHKTPSLFHINLLQEYLALFEELTHKDPLQERINVPGLNLDTNWTYRFLPKVEAIISHNELTNFMRSLL